jgi:hypothetical protein
MMGNETDIVLFICEKANSSKGAVSTMDKSKKEVATLERDLLASL